ncbi:helix-turn-helix transcriptional regulator [Cytobacillus sp. FSL R7-0696]|uniref:helix-turn-helix domain-containing protein n=1 Tax=Cytobacillus sp. FSL R7-0696 TaxID=2921691 RepID=UPI0030F76E4D
MSVGHIIKFYREKEGMTQSQLGDGICTATHVSKIENGKTDYSLEIIQLFSQKLQIDLQKESEKFEEIEKTLHSFNEALILNKIKQVESYRRILNNIPYLLSTKYAYFYQLVMLRYWFVKEEKKEIDALLGSLDKVEAWMNPYEKNFLLHMKGWHLIRYSSKKDDHYEAIAIFNKIQIAYYPNEEFYYHLALAYQYVGRQVMAYMYAEKALKYYKEINNYADAIKAESLLLLHISEDPYIDVKPMYNRLIYACELINDNDKKGMLLNNLGNTLLRRKEYNEAYQYLKESIRLCNKKGKVYIHRLFNYILVAVEGHLSSKKTLRKNIIEGQRIALELEEDVFIHLFKLLEYKLEDEQDKYQLYLAEKAFPYFKEHQHFALMKSSLKELVEMNQMNSSPQLTSELLEEAIQLI